MTAGFKSFRAGTALAAILLAGCPLHPAPPNVPGGQAIPAPAEHARPVPDSVGQRPAGHLGRPYDVAPGDSLLTLRVYRAGRLAKAGHNHLIASHELSGTIYVPSDVLGTSFEIHVPVGGLTVDEGSLRVQEGSDFSADVPDSAKDGTRRNMLGEALLDVEKFPQIVLQSERLEAGAAGEVRAHIRVEVRQASHSLLVPIRYELSPDRLVISGEWPLRQTDLGLTPFSALLGALQVQDEMRVKFRIVARAAPTSHD